MKFFRGWRTSRRTGACGPRRVGSVDGGGARSEAARRGGTAAGGTMQTEVGPTMAADAKRRIAKRFVFSFFEFSLTYTRINMVKKS